MNDKAAAKLKIGDRVHYEDEIDGGCPGTVIEKNWMALKVRYDDGVIQILHLNDCENLSHLEDRYDVTKVTEA